MAARQEPAPAVPSSAPSFATPPATLDFSRPPGGFVPPAPTYPHWVDRLVQLVNDPKIPLTIRVNGVGIKMNVIAVDRQGSRVCLLVAGDTQYELPLSPDVVLELGGETLKVGYLQQWHSFSCLPFHIVSFCALEEPKAPVL